MFKFLFLEGHNVARIRRRFVKELGREALSESIVHELSSTKVRVLKASEELTRCEDPKDKNT